MGKARVESAGGTKASGRSGETFDNLSLITAAGFGIIGIAVAWYATSLYGIGITPDSVRYFSSAQSVLEGQGFTLYNGQPLITSPPLFPALMAVLGFFGMSVGTAARVLNAALFGLIIMATDFWLVRRFKWRPLGDLMVIGVVLALPLLDIVIVAWTETLFAFLTLTFLILLEQSSQPPTGRQTVVLGLVTALACLARYIGIILIPYYLLHLLLSEGALREKTKRAVAFAGIALAPLILWLVRNFALSDTLTGNRQASSFSLTDILGQAASAIVRWYYTFSEVTRSASIATIAVILALVIVFLLTHIRSGRSLATIWRRLIVPGFAVYYLLCLIVLACITDFDQIGNRLTSPVFVPLLLLIFLVLDQLADGGRRKIALFKKIVVAVLCVAWLGTCLYRTAEFVTYTANNGAGGYAVSGWHQSELIAYLRVNPPPGTLYSNAPDAVFVLSGRRARLSPRQSGPSLSGERLGLDDFNALVEREGSAYIAWFSNVGRPYMYSPKALSSHFILQPQRRVEDGTLYRALPLPRK